VKKTRSSSPRNASSVKSSGKASGRSEGLRSRMLDFIAEHVEDHGYPPSVREIGKHVDRSPQVVLIHLDRLESEGYLTRAPGIPRSLRLMRGAVAVDRLIAGLLVLSGAYLLMQILRLVVLR
jgi:SOS-response transcriptional repressor LexA